MAEGKGRVLGEGRKKGGRKRIGTTKQVKGRDGKEREDVYGGVRDEKERGTGEIERMVQGKERIGGRQELVKGRRN